MTELSKLTIEEAREGLRKKTFSALELTKACLKSVEEAKELNAVVHDTSELAIKQASNADQILSKGAGESLCGIPIGVKDLFCTKGVHTQAGSHILDGFKPEYESTNTKQLW